MEKLRLTRAILCKRLRFSSQPRRALCSGTGAEGSEANQEDIPRVYDVVNGEQTALKKWKNLNRKRATSPDDSVFRMILPPPNVTGKLHLGHFLTLAVEDTLARWKLMTGINVEWIPGFDHAGIATQSVVNRKLSKQPKTGYPDIGQHLVDFAGENLQSIKSQLMKSGALLDWNQTYYTLDPRHSEVVQEAFLQLFNTGLIKRKDGIVNWSCALKTSIADIEIDKVDFDKKMSLTVPNYERPVEFGVLYFIAYSIVDSNDKLVVATSRPETMFGDVALAVNPSDSRYSEFVGKQAINPVNGSVIPVITDSLVKPDFGTGIVKITPAHDKLDFTIGANHNLNYATVFTPEGLLNYHCETFQGLPRFIARSKVLEMLDKANSLLKEVPYSGSVSICNRSGDVIEPRIVPHWFLQTQFLSNKLIKAIEDKSFLIIPENHARSLIHKIIESQDWCLSRQIQWGHKIPAYHHVNHPERWVVTRDAESAATKLEQELGEKVTIEDIVQDKDVLDTWFSSALIPLAISGWPDSDEFKEITLMETGHDILLFWVWRMTILTLALANRFPFRNVLLHGIVTDAYGRKMSKSKGNVIDPIHVIDGITYEKLLEEAKMAHKTGELDENEYNLRKVSLARNHSHGFPICGNDALRLTLLSQNIFDQDITLDLNYLDNCRRFTNKLWQALRFLKFHTSAPQPSATNLDSDSNEFACKWLLSCLYDYNKSCESALNQGNFHLYADATRKFFYHELCDIYIELIKGEIKAGNDATKFVKIMQYAFEVGVKLAHPLIPFVTEEIWSYLCKDKTASLLEQDFPSSKDLEHFSNPNLINSMEKGMHLTREIRSVKRRSGWTSKAVPQVYIEGDKSLLTEVVELKEYIAKLSGSEITFGRYPTTEKEKATFGSYLVDVVGNLCRIHIPLINGAEKFHDSKVQKLKLKLMKLKQQYENPSYQLNAPPEAKEKLKKKVESLLLQLQDTGIESDTNQKPNPNHPS